VKLELTIENTQLKSRVEQAQKLHSTLTSELTILRTQTEQDRVFKTQLESENAQFREHWGDIHQQIDSEKTTNRALAREIQELEKQIKLHEVTQAANIELTTRVEMLEARIKDEQSKKAKLDSSYQDLLHAFNELDRKRVNFENLGVFSDKLSQSVPTFTAQVTEIGEKLSGHINFLNEEATQRDNIRALIADLQQNTQNELRKQSELISSIASYLQPKKLEHIDVSPPVFVPSAEDVEEKKD